jgi:hypothetical protein
MNLYTEAKCIAEEALAEAGGDEERAQEIIHETCDGHRVSISYHEGIKFCVDQNTSDGEDYLEDCGGIAQPGDSFGAIACRVAYATLYCAAFERLGGLLEQKKETVL